MRLSLLLGSLLIPFAAFAGPKNYDVKIEGMTCGSCVKSVTTALSKIPNVDEKSVKVVLKEKTATLMIDEANTEASEQIKKAIEEAGFTVTAVNLVDGLVDGKIPESNTKTKKSKN
jgi:copper chaperone